MVGRVAISAGKYLEPPPKVSNHMKKLDKNLAFTLVRQFLSDDLRLPAFRGHPKKTLGHCYISSETLFHLIPKRLGFKPHVVSLPEQESTTHWFLMNDKGEVLDPTYDQFDDGDLRTWLWASARRCAFLTKKPSKRARVLMGRIKKFANESLEKNI